MVLDVDRGPHHLRDDSHVRFQPSMTLRDDIHARVPGARGLVAIDDATVEDIMIIREIPGTACDCPGCVDGWHTRTVSLGPLTLVRAEKCGGCDENGLTRCIVLN